MKRSAASPLQPRTRRLVQMWLALVVCAGVVGAVLWVLTVARLGAMQADIDRLRNLDNPPENEAQLADHYQAGRDSYAAHDYRRAVTLFQQVYAVKKEYRDTAVYLLLSETALGAQAAGNPAQFAQAAAAYAEAQAIIDRNGPQVSAVLGQNPTLLPPDTPTYATFVQAVARRSANASAYAQGDAAQSHQPGWWDVAIPQWETVYQSDPTYLNSLPHYGIAERLAATYQSKAIYMCRAKNNAAEASAAVSRAIEIARRSALPPDIQTALANLNLVVTQTRCQS